MMLIFFFNGLAFGGLGLAAYLQHRQESDLPLNKHLLWLSAFGIACGLTNWADMFLASTGTEAYLVNLLTIARTILQPLSGLFLLKFGWDILRDIPLPPWTIFLPGILIVPVAYVLTYATTTFITPSPLEIPIDIWSRYLLYLPGSIMAGIGFLRQTSLQRANGLPDVAKLMLGAGLAFLFEAFIVGLVVPAAPYAPSSYYNYNRVIDNAFSATSPLTSMFSGFSGWLDYQRVLDFTGLPIQFWRMLSSFAVTFFVVKGLDVFEARRKARVVKLEQERDLAKDSVFETLVTARKTAEKWTEVMVNINRRIIQFDDVDAILIYIIEQARELLNTDFIGLALFDEEQTFLELKCYSTRDSSRLLDSKEIIQYQPIQEAIQNGHVLLSSGQGTSKTLQGLVYGIDQPAREAGIVRLELEGRPIGALWVVRYSNKPYSETDMVWLECMADQVVIAIQHALMTSQLQSLSITEERARIARDMHDGLAQILGYMNLQVQTLDALLKQGKQDALVSELDQMRKAVKVANADVRENILSLRTTLANEKGSVSAMGDYLFEFGIQTGIETQLLDEVGNDLKLSSIAEVQLVCIFQETLANVRKHAQANHVKVQVNRERNESGEFLHLQIVDDGIGIQKNGSKRSFGIKTMKERAISVGGIVEISSETGQGTTLNCSIPCLEAGKFKNSQALFPNSSNVTAV
jgi:signal transduction histidine kinase